MVTTLTFEGFDLELAGELQIVINDIIIASMPEINTPEWDEVWVTPPFSVDLTPYVKPVDNDLIFQNPLAFGFSRIRNVKVTHNGSVVLDVPSEVLIVGSVPPDKRSAFYSFNIETYIPPLTAWYGIGEDYLLWSQESGLDFVEEWNKLLDSVSIWKFNTIRLAFHFPELGPNPMGWHEQSDLDYAKLDIVLSILNQRGLKAILDDHSYASFGSPIWIDAWIRLAEAFKGDTRIAGYEIRNEASTWSWGPEVVSTADVPYALASCTDAIRVVEPSRVIIWPDPLYYDFFVPVDAQRSNITYAFHVWNQYNDVGAALAKALDEEQKMANWLATYPSSKVWLGEVGSWTGQDKCDTGPCIMETQDLFLNHILGWCLRNDIGFSLFFYHNWNRQVEYDNVLSEIGFPPSTVITPETKTALILLVPVVALVAYMYFKGK